MSKWNARMRAVTGIAVLTATTACAKPYVEATSEFADATSAGMKAFVPAFDTASQLCRARARYDYAFARVQNASDMRWSDYIAKHDVPGQGTWAKHCAKLAEGDAMLLNGLRALTGYAEALSAVAEAGDYDGAKLTELVESSSALAGKLGADGNAHTDTVKGLAGPIGTIAGWIVQAHARRHLREAIKQGAPHGDAILDALEGYNEATGAELAAARKNLADLLDAIDRRLVVDRHPNPNASTEMPLQPDGMAVLSFHEAARRYEQELDDFAATQAAYAGVLRGLRAAQGALVAAADEKKTDVDAMREVMGIASDVITQIETIKSVAEGASAP